MVRETKDNETRSDCVTTDIYACTSTLSPPHMYHPLPHYHPLTPSTSTLSPPHTIHFHTVTHLYHPLHTVTPSHPPPHPLPPPSTASPTAELDCNTLLLPRMRDPAECFFPIFSFCEGCGCDGVGGSDISDTFLRIDDCADLKKREGKREGGGEEGGRADFFFGRGSRT